MRIELSGLLSRSRRLLEQLFRSAPRDGRSILNLNPLRLPSAGPRPCHPFPNPMTRSRWFVFREIGALTVELLPLHSPSLTTGAMT